MKDEAVDVSSKFTFSAFASSASSNPFKLMKDEGSKKEERKFDS